VLKLPHSCFIHIPKTGGSWVAGAIRSAGIPCEEYAIDGDRHVTLADCPWPEVFKFAFVRNPLDIIRSYWRYKMGAGWEPENDIDRACASASFPEFVDRLLTHFPGVCSAGFERFVGPPDGEIEFVGRQENLAEDLVSALRAAGERFDEAAIRQFPRQNMSDRRAFPADYDDDLRRRVRAAERAAFIRFGYS